MSSIIIASDTFEIGQQLAEKTASALEYSLVDRTILNDLGREYDLDLATIEKVLDQDTSLFPVSRKTRQKVLATLEAVTLEHLAKDFCVCHGLFAHMFVRGVPHVAKVRVLAGDRGRNGEVITNNDKTRSHRWAMEAFGVDCRVHAHYDLMISMNTIEEQLAVGLITETIRHRKFQAMTYSLNCINDLLLAAQARVSLLEQFPEVRVNGHGGKVEIYIKNSRRDKIKRASIVKGLVGGIPGIKRVEVHSIKDFIKKAEIKEAILK